VVTFSLATQDSAAVFDARGLHETAERCTSIFDIPVSLPSSQSGRKRPIFISQISYILFASLTKNVVIIRRRFGSQTRRQKIAVRLQTRQSQPIGTTLALSSPRRLFLVVDPQMEVEVSIGHAVCNRRCNERCDGCRQ